MDFIANIDNVRFEYAMCGLKRKKLFLGFFLLLTG